MQYVYIIRKEVKELLKDEELENRVAFGESQEDILEYEIRERLLCLDENEDISYRSLIQIPMNKWIYHLPVNDENVRNYRRSLIQDANHDGIYATRLKYKEDINTIIGAVKDFYGEENVNNNIEGDRKNSCCINFTIRYGDTTISNLNRSHKIRGLYINFSFLIISKKEGKLDNTIRIARSVQTLSEERTGYIHSHVSNSEYGIYDNVCLGNSPLLNYQQEHWEISPEVIEEILMHLDHSIQFENVGNPYHRISGISSPLVGDRGIHTPSFNSLDIYFPKSATRDIIYNCEEDIGVFDMIQEQAVTENIMDSFLIVKIDETEITKESYDRFLRNYSKIKDKNKVISIKKADIVFNGNNLRAKIISDLPSDLPRKPVYYLSNKNRKNINRWLQQKAFTKLKKKINVPIENKDVSTSTIAVQA